jgi:hypothetical protein
MPLAHARVVEAPATRIATTDRRSRPFAYDRIIVPSLIVDHTLLSMRQAGVAGHERFLVWAGSIVSGDAFVSTIVVPRVGGNGFHGEVPADIVATVFDALDERDLFPLAQLHTHPGRADMSSIDAQRPLVAISGFRSIIVPDFAFIADDDITRWNIYEYRGPGQWALNNGCLVVDDSLIRID